MLALLLPLKVSIIHCSGHQKNQTTIARGSYLADQATKKVAIDAVVQLPTPILPHFLKPPEQGKCKENWP